MYNEIDRENVYNYIIDMFKTRDEVISILQVGSGAIGYRDKYSDLDFAIVVDDTNIQEIFKKTYDKMNEKYNIYFFDNMEDRKLQLFLLDNYLEIDIGYYTLDNLYARRENYRIIMDKSNKVENIMKSSWLEMKEKNKGTSQEVDMKKIISNIDKELWYNTLHSVVSFKRNNIYRCYYELEQIKGYVIDLVAKRNSKESKRYRSINELEESDLKKIEYLFIYPKTYDELSNYLEKSLLTIFDEFNYWKNNDNIDYNGNPDYYLNFIHLNKWYYSTHKIVN